MGLVNLLEGLTELRETLYLREYWFITKDMIKNTDEYPDGTEAWGKVCGKGHGAPMRSEHAPLPKYPCAHQARSSPRPLLLSFYGGMADSIVGCYMIQSQPFSLSRK